MCTVQDMCENVVFRWSVWNFVFAQSDDSGKSETLQPSIPDNRPHHMRWSDNAQRAFILTTAFALYKARTTMFMQFHLMSFYPSSEVCCNNPVTTSTNSLYLLGLIQPPRIGLSVLTLLQKNAHAHSKILLEALEAVERERTWWDKFKILEWAPVHLTKEDERFLDYTCRPDVSGWKTLESFRQHHYDDFKSTTKEDPIPRPESSWPSQKTPEARDSWLLEL